MSPDFPAFTEPPPKRPRGAPPGNLNALKHGFYSRVFRKMELGDLQSVPLKDLQDEISMLRVLIRRVVEFSQQASTLDEYLRLLSTLSQATANLGRLVRTQHLLAASPTSELDAAFEIALKELYQEWGLDKNLP